MARTTPPPIRHPTERLVGEAPAIQTLRERIRQLAAFDAVGNPHVPTLLLHGETGTGKGLIARLIHDSGPRARGPFIDVNCGALPETLLEAELFGFEAGAFTDAKRGKPGLFEAAAGGTLFLDEIDGLPLALQSKVLIAVEEKRVRRLGAVWDQQIDVKLIAATQVDLGAHAHAGRFRADLYHRLAVVVLKIPPLRERGEDIVLLAQSFLRQYATAHRISPKQLSAAAEAWLRHHPWPGNVRELAHLMERVTLLCPDAILEPAALAQWSLAETAPIPPSPAASVAAGAESIDEPARLRQALRQTGGNVTQAAKLLGLSRKALRYRMQRHGIEVPRLDEPLPPPIEPTPPEPPPQVQRRAEPPRMQPRAPGAGWEQRTVAVLAIDLSFPKATELAGSAAEPWRVTRRWEDTIVDKIYGFGGVFLRQSPPLVVAGFGLPRSLEQMPHRAVQAALTIGRIVEEAQLAAGEEPCPEVRQAVHLGPVLVDMAAPDPIMRLPAVGDTLALPMRLLGHAAPGEILITTPAARLVEGVFALQARELPLRTGTPDQRLAYAVVGLKARQPAEGLAARTRSPFVGRERELAILHDLLTVVEGGHGQVVGIVGEPGMGKSRLLWEFRQQLAAPHVMYLQGRCLAYHQGSPYLPVLEILQQYMGITELDPPEAVVEKVRGGLQTGGMDPAAPFLLHMLGIKQRGDQLADLTPQMIKARTFEALCQLSLNANRPHPLVLAIEDLHWIDDTSAEFVASLVDRLSGSPILLLYTYRPGYRPPGMQKSYATQLTLKPLLSRDSLRVVQSVLPTEPIPEALAHAILAKAEGNPFFLEELAQTVTTRGEQGAGLELPDTIQGALMARIDGLPEACKQLVQTLAVIGHPCPISLLTRLMGQPVDELQGPLSTIQRRELLYEQPAMPGSTYLLKHALVQDVAYYALPVERRREIHKRIAKTIETLYRDRLAEHYGELARHYQHSGNTAQAVVYLQCAGQWAVERSANPEAVQHLTSGLTLLATLPEAPARSQQELDLQTALGSALSATKGPAAPEVEQAYARARALCQQVGEPPQLFPTLRGLWGFYQNRGALPTARELGEQLYRLAQREAAPTHLLEAHDALGKTLFYLGEYADARTHFEQGIALIEPTAQPALALRYGETPGLRCLADLAPTLWCLGYPAEALQRSQEALALAQELAHPYSLAYAQFYAAYLHHRRREAPAVQAQAEALLTLATAQGFTLWVELGTLWRGWALVMQGQAEVGLTQMRQAIATVSAMGQTLARPLCLVLLAEAVGHAGQVAEGLRLLADAVAAFEASGRGDLLAETYRLQGELLLRQAVPDAARAEACFQQALALARRQHARSWELRAATSLSRLWQLHGKRQAAHDLLAPIYGWFTEDFDTAGLQDAKALLEELTEASPAVLVER